MTEQPLSTTVHVSDNPGSYSSDPAPVTFANFKFTTIGQPPTLLNRFTDPEPELLYPSPSPEPEPIQQDANPTQAVRSSRPSLLQSLSGYIAQSPVQDDMLKPSDNRDSSIASSLSSTNLNGRPHPPNSFETSEPSVGPIPDRNNETSTTRSLNIVNPNTTESNVKPSNSVPSLISIKIPRTLADASKIMVDNHQSDDFDAVIVKRDSPIRSDATAPSTPNKVPLHPTMSAILAPFYEEAAREQAEWNDVYTRAQDEQKEFHGLVQEAAQIIERLQEKARTIDGIIEEVNRKRGGSVVKADTIERATRFAVQEYHKSIEETVSRAKKLEEQKRLADEAALLEARRLEDEKHKAAEAAAKAKDWKIAREQQRVIEGAALKKAEEERQAESRRLEEKRKEEERAAQIQKDREEAQRKSEYEAKRAAFIAARNKEADANAVRVREKLEREKLLFEKSKRSQNQTPPAQNRLASATPPSVAPSTPNGFSSHERERPLSGGVKLAVATSSSKAVPSPVSPSIPLPPRPTSVASRMPVSATVPFQNAPTVKNTATSGFVPARTEAGKNVATEMPFSSIKLASESKRKTVQDVVGSRAVNGIENIASSLQASSTPTRENTTQCQSSIEPELVPQTKLRQTTSQTNKKALKAEPDTSPSSPLSSDWPSDQKRQQPQAKRVRTMGPSITVKREPSLEYATPSPEPRQDVPHSILTDYERPQQDVVAMAMNQAQTFAVSRPPSRVQPGHQTQRPPSSGPIASSSRPAIGQPVTMPMQNFDIRPVTSAVPPEHAADAVPLYSRREATLRPEEPASYNPYGGSRGRPPHVRGPVTPPRDDQANRRDVPAGADTYHRNTRVYDHYSPPRTDDPRARAQNNYYAYAVSYGREFTPDVNRKRGRSGDNGWREDDHPPRSRQRIDGNGFVYDDHARTPPLPAERMVQYPPRPESPPSGRSYATMESQYVDQRHPSNYNRHSFEVPSSEYGFHSSPRSWEPHSEEPYYETTEECRSRTPEADYARQNYPESVDASLSSPVNVSAHAHPQARRKGKRVTGDADLEGPGPSVPVDSLLQRISDGPTQQRGSPRTSGGRKTQAGDRSANTQPRGQRGRTRTGGGRGGKSLAERIHMDS